MSPAGRSSKNSQASSRILEDRYEKENPMTARSLFGNSLVFLAALSLACSGERSIAPTSSDISTASSPQTARSGRFYAQHNLVSDGAVAADHVDAALVNAWGL